MARLRQAATTEQMEVCRRFGLEPFLSFPDSMLASAPNLREGIYPLNGLRYPPEGHMNGWFLWAGEVLSQDPDFFDSIHVAHVAEWNAEVIPYLALPPGWRFLIAPGYEDVWFDPQLFDL